MALGRLGRLDAGPDRVGKCLWLLVCEMNDVTEPPAAVPAAVVGVLANYTLGRTPTMAEIGQIATTVEASLPLR